MQLCTTLSVVVEMAACFLAVSIVNVNSAPATTMSASTATSVMHHPLMMHHASATAATASNGFWAPKATSSSSSARLHLADGRRRMHAIEQKLAQFSRQQLVSSSKQARGRGVITAAAPSDAGDTTPSGPFHLADEVHTSISPNVLIAPSTAIVNERGHLDIGGVDTVELAKRYGTPLWIVDEQTVVGAMHAYKEGLKAYPGESLVLYAGKAFMTKAMCRLAMQEGLGVDVVSQGELRTAIEAGVPPERIFMHGNNKAEEEVLEGLRYGHVNIVVDGASELEMVARVASRLATKARVLLRVIPDVAPDTHKHIVTGHAESKFGIPLAILNDIVKRITSKDMASSVELLGLHAHIGSQLTDLDPFMKSIEVLVANFVAVRREHGVRLTRLDIGGGLGIQYTADQPAAIPIHLWAERVGAKVADEFFKHDFTDDELPLLLVEPGRSIVGTAGVTLYRVGHTKPPQHVFVDGGMADNARPITYQSKYTAVVANRMNEPFAAEPVSLAGRFCESGDVLIKRVFLQQGVREGDVVAVFGTGAYNYSQSSNYNRSPRPACVLVADGRADVIVKRESVDSLLAHDQVPDRLLASNAASSSEHTK